MGLSLVYVVVCRLFQLVVLLGRRERSKELEILVLRHELSILCRQVDRPRFEPSGPIPARRAQPGAAAPLVAGVSSCGRRRSCAGIAGSSPLWALPHRRPGRPPSMVACAELVVRLARENTGWGYVSIVGELRKLEIDVSASLVRNILKAAGVPPSAERDRLSWRTFLRQHAATTLACDFLTVDTVLLPAAVRARLHLRRQSPGRVHGVHEQSRRRLDAAAGAQPADGPRRSRAAGRGC